ncbi:hypothetical protein SPHINGOT1_470041 [Sphingomonas sp. T1]|nr:hypothetical protein SPHINGOT1_470041 [Sphingomonas sp. T1]
MLRLAPIIPQAIAHPMVQSPADAARNPRERQRGLRGRDPSRTA